MSQNIFPTKNNLIKAKKSLKLAKVGYDLMDRKRSVLVREIMSLMNEAEQIQSQIAQKYAEAYASLSKAHIEMGDCEEAAQCIPVENSVKITTRSVMGIEIPTVTAQPTELLPYYAFSTTCAALDDAYEKFNEAKQLTIRLAELENSVCRLADAVKKTSKRTNALGNIMIPQFEDAIKFISTALDEKEREEFSRLKVIKSTKK